jgi:O-antigen/teichoic acid export membrane protein
VIGIRALAEIAALALSVATTIIVTRSVGPSSFGFYAVSAVLVQLGVLVSGLGLGQAGSVLVARDGVPVPRVVATIVPPRLVAALALATAGEVVLAVGPLDPRLRGVLGPALLALPLAAIRTEWLFVALGRVGVAAALRVSGALSALALAVTAIHGEGDTFGLGLLLLVPIAAPAALGVVGAVASGLLSWGPRASAADVRAALASGSHFLRGELSTFVTTSSDRLFLFAFAAPTVVGLYDAAYRIIQPFYSVAAVVNDAYYAKLASALGDAERRRRVLRRYVDLSCVATIPVGFLLVAHSGPIVGLIYGEPFAGASAYLSLLGWVITLGFTAGVLVFPLTAWGRSRDYGDAVMAGSATNLALNVALIPFLSGVGAALATVAAKGVVTLAGLRAFRRVVGEPIVRDLVVWCAVSAIALGLSLLVVAAVGAWPGLIAFAIVYSLAAMWSRFRGWMGAPRHPDPAEG